MPSGMSTDAALAFAEEKSAWIRRHLARHSGPETVRIGTTLLFRGAGVPIAAGKVRRAEFRDGRIVVPDRPEMAGARVQALLKLSARADLTRACERHAATLGRDHGRITLRDTRSRWGSCSGRGDLMFSWRLVMAPPEVLGYVAAHEVAHLVEMNHSPAYWAVVERLLPDFAAPRAWLRENGHLLHRYRFGD